MHVGPFYEGNGHTSFTVWAPLRKKVDLVLSGPQKRQLPMERDEMGYWHAHKVPAGPGELYKYRLDNSMEFPDPGSRFQPEGVHGPSSVVDFGSFAWSDSHWKGVELDRMVIYELHIGTFTPGGTFEACAEKLDYLKSLGVNTIEIMPVAQFPGSRNWGYDGAYPFAAQNSYGGPEGLMYLVDQCHKKEMSVVLDVVYNHLGPEGAYLHEYGPYFTDEYNTPWGAAVNYDQAYSYGVRNYFIQNALAWLSDYHIDALRLDAIHGIYDFGAFHILREIAEAVEQLSDYTGRKRILIAESDLNDTRVINPFEKNGYGIDAQWSDDFHHSVHTLLTGENRGYYEDFGSPGELCKAYNEGFVYSWTYSRNRKRYHGSSSKDISPEELVVCIQNHDQVGNRMLGERLSMLVSFDGLKVAAASMVLSPYTPMLFMGQEFAAQTPFLYFISHLDEHLVQLVREGRAREFAEFKWEATPPDPQAQSTFEKSKLDWDSISKGNHKQMLEFYRTLFELRREHPSLRSRTRSASELFGEGKSGVVLLRRGDMSKSVAFLNFSEKEVVFTGKDAGIENGHRLIDSQHESWGGEKEKMMPGELKVDGECRLAPLSVALYELD
ncbi:MAG: malto-oligosyltrehalose trehalohydrolase [Chitinispirillaceae bacterium]